MTDNDNRLRVGDRVAYRPFFGALTVGTVTALEETAFPREKYGSGVKSTTWRRVRADCCIVTFGSGWAYGSQIDGVEDTPL